MKFKRLSKKEVFKNDVYNSLWRKAIFAKWQHSYMDFFGKKDAVAIVAEHEGKVILVKQYRPAIKKELIEIPAGLVEKRGEDILKLQKEEFEEETGYRAGKDWKNLYLLWLCWNKCRTISYILQIL